LPHRRHNSNAGNGIRQLIAEMSGCGRESGLQQMDKYLNVKAVWIKTA
jgi:hypothetical protein